MPGSIRRLIAHARQHAVAYLALFLALGGTSAYAANTIGSADVIDESLLSADLKNGEVKASELATDAVRSAKIAAGNVTASDLAPGAVTTDKVTNDTLTGDDVNESSLNLAAEGWHEVGAPGQPAFNSNDRSVWHNFYGASHHNSAAFLRDRHGFVHLKGVVDVDNVGVNECALRNDSYECSGCDRVIFTLPPGYRPAKREAHVSISNDNLARINVDAWGYNWTPAGAVSIDQPTQVGDAHLWVSLDGISFRCAPSGVNGCP